MLTPPTSRASAAACMAGMAVLANLGDPSPANADPEAPGVWEDVDFTVGAGTSVAPDYEGDDSYELGFVPVLEASWKDIVFVGTEGAWLTYPLTEEIRFGPLVSYDPGRDDDDSSDLRGLGDVDPTATVGAILQIDLGPAEFAATLEHGLSSHEGWLAELSIGREFRLSPRLSLGLAAETSLADGDYMNAYFGVSPRQASRSGLEPFDADGGFKSVGMTAELGFALADDWTVFGSTSYARLVGDAADSPLVERRGSANQVSAIVGLTFHF